MQKQNLFAKALIVIGILMELAPPCVVLLDIVINHPVETAKAWDQTRPILAFVIPFFLGMWLFSAGVRLYKDSSK